MDTPEDPRIGTTLLGKLRVDGLLGEGGMGAVYKVHHEVTKHDRALKVLHAQFADDAVIYQRLLREAGVAGTLRTDHVVETFDVGKLEDGSPYVLMELMKGEDLAERMEGEKLSVATLVGFVCQACEGIVHAHAAGIIHRDLKPDNLFVVNEAGSERIKLLDFGISKFHIDPIKGGGAVTQEGTVMGTPLYMSPEQAVGKTVGPQTDIYSLGVILYEGISGVTPHKAESFPAFLLKLHTEAPLRLEELVPNVDPKLAAVVHKALSIEPEDRYPSAQALLRVLLPFAEGSRTAHLQTLNGMPSVDPEIHPPKRRAPVATADTMASAGLDMSSTAPATHSAKTPAAARALTPGPSEVDALPPTQPWWPWALAAAVAISVGAALVWGGGAEPEPVPRPLADATSPTPEVPDDAGTAAEAPSELPSTPMVNAVPVPPGEDPPEPAAVPAPPAAHRPPRARPAAEEPGARFEIERANPY